MEPVIGNPHGTTLNNHAGGKHSSTYIEQGIMGELVKMKKVTKIWQKLSNWSQKII